MILNENFNVNEKGHLTIENIDVRDLVNNYATPLYVVSKRELLNNTRNYKEQLGKHFYNSDVAYASKALACKEIYRIINEEGICLDVASSGELYTAISVEFPASRIYFHGNNKNNKDLEYAVESGVGYIVVDNISELKRLSDIAEAHNIIQKVLLRIAPGVEPDTHHHIVTGGIDSKFGLPSDSKDLFRLLDSVAPCKGIILVGLHCHIGSQITDVKPYIQTVEIMINLLSEFNEYLEQRKTYNYDITELNLGGGFGIPYLENQKVPDIAHFLSEISRAVKENCIIHNIPEPKIMFEPGRSIIGTAGITLYTVGNIKEIENIRTYVSVDGGMSDNIRYALYESDYIFDIAEKISEPKVYKVTIAGRCCETGDLLGKDVMLQKASENDILSVYPTGAYNYSMASNYNRLPRPAMVMVDGSDVYEIIRKETFEDLLRFDI